MLFFGTLYSDAYPSPLLIATGEAIPLRGLDALEVDSLPVDLPGAAAAAAKSLQSCLILCDPIDGSAPGSPVPGILQANISICMQNSKEQQGEIRKPSLMFNAKKIGRAHV